MRSSDLSAVVTSKGRLQHLQQTLPRLLDQMPVTLVDWDCPDRSGDWAEGLGRGVKVVRVHNQPHWHRSRALNAGVQATTSEWVLILDADMLMGGGVGTLLDIFWLRPQTFLISTKTRLTGLLVVRREDFDAVGGYYEDMPGRGWQDVDLRCRLHLQGLQHRVIPEGWFEHLDHSLQSRERFLPEGFWETVQKGRKTFEAHIEALTGKPVKDQPGLLQFFPQRTDLLPKARRSI